MCLIRTTKSVMVCYAISKVSDIIVVIYNYVLFILLYIMYVI